MLRAVRLVKGHSTKEVQDTEMELVLFTSTSVQVVSTQWSTQISNDNVVHLKLILLTSVTSINLTKKNKT